MLIRMNLKRNIPSIKYLIQRKYAYHSAAVILGKRQCRMQKLFSEVSHVCWRQYLEEEYSSNNRWMGSNHHKPPPKEEEGLFHPSNMIRKSHTCTPLQHHYSLLQPLEEGSLSTVYQATTVATKQPRVLKQLPKRPPSTSKPSKQNSLLNEYQILRQLDHPNIIRMFEMLEDEQHYYIVTQYIPHRDALEMLHRMKIVPEIVAFQLFYQTLKALHYLHKSHVMHRDIKLENLIFDQKNHKLKLLDFGSALRFADCAPKERKLTGTIHYISPEVLNKYYDKRCDIWSLGVVLYVLLSGNAPFVGENHSQIIQSIRNSPVQFEKPIWKTRSAEVKDLITRMLEKDFKKRIAIPEILEHSWVRERYKKQDENEGIRECLERLVRFKRVRVSDIQLGILIFMLNFIVERTQQSDTLHTFWIVNSKNDGFIDEGQLKNALTKILGYTCKEASQVSRQLMIAIDINASGDITYSEFKLAAMDLRTLLSPVHLEQTFRYIDADNSGAISASQLQARLGQHLEEAYYAKVVAHFDLDGDGQINRHQFQRMMVELLKNY